MQFGVLLKKCYSNVFNLVSSFHSHSEYPPNCVALIHVEETISDCLSTLVPGKELPTNIKTFGSDELESSLAIPTAQITERHHYQTFMDLSLMMVRTALNRKWAEETTSFVQDNLHLSRILNWYLKLLI